MRLIAAVSLLALIGVVVWRLWPQASPLQAKPKVTFVKKKQIVQASSGDFSLRDLPDDVLRDLDSFFEKRKDHHSVNMQLDVDDGETLITDMYEARPGEYIYSKVTPHIKKDKFGNFFVQVATDIQSISFDGKSGTVFTDTRDLSANGNSSGMLILQNDGNQWLALGGKVGAGGRIHLSINASFTSKNNLVKTETTTPLK